MDNLYAWCIVPFDSANRTPEERIAMLMDLGFRQYVYDWRVKHLPEMSREWRLAKESGVDVMGVWLWIEEGRDQPGQLRPDNEQLFAALAETGLKTQIWLSFNAGFFKGLSDDEALAKGVEMISYLNSRAGSLGCRLALYNHGDWFGEPENQVKIIKALPGDNIGIVYNFHHAHHQIDRFPAIVETMAPYLWAVSLNGMRKEGPKTLTIGQGDQEKKMVDLLYQAGFTGPYGILGHVKEADVEDILTENLNGLNAIQ